MLIFALLFALSTAAQAPASATHVTTADVMAALKQGPQNPVVDLLIRTANAGGYTVGIAVVRRAKSEKDAPLVHERVTEIYNVMEGAGTLVTGGTLVGPTRRIETSQVGIGPSTSATDIQGGESRRIAAGDVVVIPAGMPHKFSSIEGPITYLVTRIDIGSR